MKKIIILSLIAGALLALDIEEFPRVNERVMPQVSKNSVYSYYDAIKDAKEAVVNISTQKKIKANARNQQQLSPFMNDPFFRQFFGEMFEQMVPRDRVERSLGSGVIITKDGFIITNNHVVGSADEIIVTLPGDKKEYKAKLIGKDPRSDLAVIKIEAKNMKYIKFGDSNDLREGDVVFAIGNPFGVGETLTSGIISALNKSGMGINDYENFIQTDAPINPGNSGGALVDTRGALIGINTAIISQGGGNVGIGFAIPSNMTKKIVTQLVEKGEVERGYMGVSIQDVTEDLVDFYGTKEGAVITSLDTDSPAYKAGLRSGDLITEVDGKKIKSSSELKNEIGGLSPSDEVIVIYKRDNKSSKATIKLTKYPDESASLDRIGGNTALEGLEVSELTPQLRSKYRIDDVLKGVVVVGIKQGSEAQEIGFMEGDVITRIEQMGVDSISDLKSAVNKYKSAKKRVYVYRKGMTLIVVLK